RAANALRQSRGKGTRGRVLATAMDFLTQTGKLPSGRTVGQELGITRQQANRHLKALREAGLI
ncbi:TPA: transcriptional regulator, partial [Corynebacterium striatum]|nr:transcriptional regulator [Corynebacterium striatum]